MTADAANAAAPSTRLGRYEILGRVGKGGMAEVLLAREAGSLDRWVAIKRVHPELARHKMFVQMLLDEARLAARIAHPSVAQVLELGEADGVPYIVMEYLHGQPLSEVIHRSCEGGAPDLDLMARVVADAAEGVHAAHELRDADGKKLGLVHRDVSPQNVFVTYDGAVKVVDFGIAKARGRATLTEPGTVKGKYSYMSPEQARGGTLDRRSDVYSLGLVLYEATTGVQVFEGYGIGVLARVALSEIDPPARHRRGYPPALQQVVMRALEARVEDRFQTAREMAQELERFVVGRQALTDPASVASMMATLFPDRRGDGPGGRVASDPSLDRPPTTTTVSARVRPRSARWRTPLLVACIATIIGCVVAVGMIVSGQLTRRGALRSRAIGDPPAALVPARERPVEQWPDTVEKAAVASRATASGPASTGPAADPGAPATPSEPLAASGSARESHEPPSNRSSSSPGSVRSERVAARASEVRAQADSNGVGTLDVRSEPWSMVWVDGRAVQPTPMVGLPLSAGPHVVRLVTDDGRSRRLRIGISAGRATPIDVRF
ncbi:MAG: protein kinase [Deltaproteobacteria bacterium]|nr:protein kinase [Deltaproteobacteria bacterium]